MAMPKEVRANVPADHDLIDRARAAAVPVRVAIVFAVLAVVLELGSLVFYSAAAGFSTSLTVPPAVLLAHPNAGPLIEWGSIIDMFGYLCIAPVVLYLRDRHADAKLINLYAVGGICLVVFGSIGAVVMATAAPYLIDQYHVASSGGKQSIDLVFTAVYRAVVVGMWQTLETIPGAVWLIGTAIAIRGKVSWAVYFPLLLFGLANAGIAAYRLAGL
jgi:hypothetical protein